MEQVTNFETDNRYALCVQRFAKGGQLAWKSKNEEWNMSHPNSLVLDGNTLIMASNKILDKSTADKRDYAFVRIDTNGKWVSHHEWNTGNYDLLRAAYPIADHDYIMIGANAAYDETEVIRKRIK